MSVSHERIGAESAAIRYKIESRIAEAEVPRLAKGEMASPRRWISNQPRVRIRKRAGIWPHTQACVVEDRDTPIRVREIRTDLCHGGEHGSEAAHDFRRHVRTQRVVYREQIAQNLIVIGRRA